MRIDVHWRSSGLSALPLMCRPALIAVAIALFAMNGAQAAHDHPIDIHEREGRRPRTRRIVHFIAWAGPGPHLNGQANLRATRRKPSADEAGREAGLAILRMREGMCHRTSPNSTCGSPAFYATAEIGAGCMATGGKCDAGRTAERIGK